MGAENMAKAGKFGTKRLVIVDFAVENQDRSGRFMDHGLVAPCQIYDGKPSVGQGAAAVLEQALMVRPSMGQGLGHGRKNVALRRDSARIEKTGYAAHARFPC
jgi:hypothetical protein